MDLFDRRHPQALLANILASVGIALASNSLVFLLGWDQDVTGYTPSFEPPGWVVGIVWIFLFAGLGAARWLVAQTGSRSSQLVAALLLFCAAYPIYTLGLKPIPGLFGNLATILAAAFVANRVRALSKLAASFIGLVVVWVTFATFVISAELLKIG